MADEEPVERACQHCYERIKQAGTLWQDGTGQYVCDTHNLAVKHTPLPVI